jgi:hypothetical protein
MVVIIRFLNQLIRRTISANCRHGCWSDSNAEEEMPGGRSRARYNWGCNQRAAQAQDEPQTLPIRLSRVNGSTAQKSTHARARLLPAATPRAKFPLRRAARPARLRTTTENCIHCGHSALVSGCVHRVNIENGYPTLLRKGDGRPDSHNRMFEISIHENVVPNLRWIIEVIR